MTMPRRAVILAAGFGTRLLPLTRVVPKPLLPLGGVPMLERALAMVRSWGVTDVVVNVHHGADAMIRHLVNRKPDGLRIATSFEPEILGTGGALVKAGWFFADGKPFWVVNADVAANVDGRKIARAFVPGKTMAAAWLMASRGPRTVECSNGVITNFETKTRGADGTYTFCGVHLVDPAVLGYLPDAGFASIIEAYKKAMADGWRIAGVPVENAYWADVGTPEQYVNAEAEIQSDRSRNCAPPTSAITIKNRMIYGPGVPRQVFVGIMALRAEDALDETERALAEKWPHFRPDAVACPLAPRGSARTFTRLYAGSQTSILIRHKPDREENNLYVDHSRFLDSIGVPVPQIIAEDRLHHLTLFSDVGVTSVQDLAPTWRPHKLVRMYKDVLSTMVVFHERGAAVARQKRIRLMPAFDRKLYRWEHELFLHLFLRDHVGITESACAAVGRELKKISEALLELPSVLLHRDLQSSNILVKGSRWSLIDYQGMRMGPAVYDLASLLCDPYITIRPDDREQLIRHYESIASPESCVGKMFWPAAIQRLGQALGAYARLSKLSGAGHFVKYIPAALQNLSEALGHVPGTDMLKEVIAKTGRNAG